MRDFPLNLGLLDEGEENGLEGDLDGLDDEAEAYGCLGAEAGRDLGLK